MKKIAISKLPYQITLISLFLPLIASLLWIEFHRIILLITIGMFSIYFMQSNKKMIFSKTIFFYIIFLFFLIVYDQIFSRGLFYFSYSHIIIYVFIFYHCFLFDEKINFGTVIIRQISFIYLLIITFMVLELFFHLTGNAHILIETFSEGPYESTIHFYVEYHNRFSELVGLNIGALNSMILGNQIASQLMICAMIWFFPLYNIPGSSSVAKKSPLWFFLAFLLFIISPTMTANVLFIISISIYIFILPISKINNIKSKIIFTLFLSLVTIMGLKYLFPIFYDGSIKVINNLNQETTTLGYYIYGFSYPFFVFIEMPFWDQIFGRVNHGWAEFGYIKLLIGNGALWVFSLTFAIISIVYSAFKLLKNNMSSFITLSEKKWIWIAQVNAFICIIYFLSLIHYITIFRLGVLQLFSFHIAITMYAIKKYKIFQKLKFKKLSLQQDYLVTQSFIKS